MPGFNPTYTNVASQFGMPLFGVAGLQPFTGNFFFVNGDTGSDGNTGGPQDPFATLSQAHTVAVANNNDVVLLTGTVRTTATTTWSKDKTHLIGLTSPVMSNQRARISQTGSTVFSPLVNMTAQGCIVQNIGTFHGFADASAQVCWSDAGGRNYYENVSFLGMGNATAAAQAGGRSLVVTGSTGENTFRNCQIGLDTIASSAANASLEFAGGTPRNTFINCVFPRQTSAATPLMVLVTGAAAIDRWQWFQDCQFINNIKSTSTQMTVAMSMTNASPGGLFMLQRCSSIGSTKWGDTNALANMYVDGGAPTAASTGLAVNPS